MSIPKCAFLNGKHCTIRTKKKKCFYPDTIKKKNSQRKSSLFSECCLQVCTAVSVFFRTLSRLLDMYRNPRQSHFRDLTVSGVKCKMLSLLKHFLPSTLLSPCSTSAPVIQSSTCITGTSGDCSHWDEHAFFGYCGTAKQSWIQLSVSQP